MLCLQSVLYWKCFTNGVMTDKHLAMMKDSFQKLTFTGNEERGDLMLKLVQFVKFFVKVFELDQNEWNMANLWVDEPNDVALEYINLMKGKYFPLTIVHSIANSNITLIQIFLAFIREFVKERNIGKVGNELLDVDSITSAALGVLDRKCRDLRKWLLHGDTRVIASGSKRLKLTIPKGEYRFGFRGPKDFVVPTSNCATWTAPILVSIRNGQNPGKVPREQWKAAMRSSFMVNIKH